MQDEACPFPVDLWCQAEGISSPDRLGHKRGTMTQTNEFTISKFLTDVRNERYLIPSIQRPFVWSQTRITNLFDSLMRGFPIGTLLIWRTRPSDNPQVRYLQLHLNFQGKDVPAPSVNVKRKASLLAILDGQQRATAINIGVMGSHGMAGRHLYLNLDVENEQPSNEEPRFSFEFRTSSEDAEGRAWFPVRDALGVRPDNDSLNTALRRCGIQPNVARRQRLKRLVRALNVDKTLVTREVTADLDEVLNIFARTNMGGTTLTYVDLLMSTAASKMTLNLREAFDGLRGKLRSHGFDVSIDRVMKTCFVLLGMKEPKFHVAKLLSHSAALEKEWDDIAQAMEVACLLLKSFGLSTRTLRAENALILAASYAYHRRWSTGHVHADHTEAQRIRLQAVIARTLLIQGYWTGAVDPVLAEANRVFKNQPSKAFPMETLERALAKKGKPISMTHLMVEELCRTSYNERTSLVLLSLLFPHMPKRFPGERELAKDHIFPMSRFSTAGLKAAGYAISEHSAIQTRANQLPNLQLLGHADNTESKRTKLPSVWWEELTASQRTCYSEQGVKHLPTSLDKADSFWDKRRAFLEQRLTKLLLV